MFFRDTFLSVLFSFFCSWRRLLIRSRSAAKRLLSGESLSILTLFRWIRLSKAMRREILSFLKAIVQVLARWCLSVRLSFVLPGVGLWTEWLQVAMRVLFIAAVTWAGCHNYASRVSFCNTTNQDRAWRALTKLNKLC